MSFEENKIRLTLAYDGSDFSGWQKQKGEVATVQGCLEAALKKIFGEPVRVIGSSRTDAGVHAIHQVAHFKSPRDPKKINLLKALNALTPESVVVREVLAAPDDFHAIASTERKTYKYFIFNHELPNPFRRQFTTWIPRTLDIDFLNQATGYLLGSHDFTSFQSRGSEPPSAVRRIDQADWHKRSRNLISFQITGSGFLKQMVRNIVGTALDLYFHQREASDMAKILESRSRQQAGTTAPPQGLYLWRIYYPKDLDNKCRKLYM